MKSITRRHFLFYSAACMSAAMPSGALGFIFEKKGGHGPSDISGRVFKGDAPDTLWKWSREGFLYSRLENGKVACGICPNRCVLSPGDRSVCRSKINYNGKLYSLAYGNPCSVNMDPVEKKPLFHFKPGTSVFSIATTGCNLRCLNCQNWEISQAKPEEARHYDLFPADVVQSARQSKSESIAYTYSEATTFFEYMIDTSRIARDSGIYNLWISNGYINTKPLLELCKVLDGANINLKSFSDEIYRRLNGGRLEPVLNTLKTLHERKIHFEITHLVVPDYTDDADMIKRMCRWILKNLGPDYPIHFSRFAPKYKLDRLPPTPISTLSQFRETAMKEGVHYVYVGNVPGHEGQNTFCHACKKLIVERAGYAIPTYNLIENKCRFCGTLIPGRW